MPETCEERDYRCCELMPPVVVIDGEVETELTAEEYDGWYVSHVTNFDQQRRAEQTGGEVNG